MPKRNNPESFGARLKERMAELGLSQSALAKKVGIDRTEINRMVSGQRKPKPDQVAWLATALETTVENLLGDELPPDLTKTQEELEKLAARILEAEANFAKATREAADAQAALQASQAAFDRERSELLSQLERERRARATTEQALNDAKTLVQHERSERLTEVTLQRIEVATALGRIKELEQRDAGLRSAIAKEQSEKFGVGALTALAGLFVGAALNEDRPKRRR